ncbi:hypothetical protein MsAg5_10550 [Methanosarcinaceae archaeon Ag5]|uniref:Uncharacterized protein n=1 Tax=Methanolapillus africanus TaxID=3028297 RepID=A0AAE4MIH2_9EURY|nr:hypothetical protein [Methanosarcinaceae archaeon Ag5]
MATSSYTDTAVIKNKKSIALLKKYINGEIKTGNDDDLEVDVFEEMRRCNELL